MPASGGIAKSVTLTDYFDVGRPVHVDRPPAGEVTDGHSPPPQRATGPAVTIGRGTADGIPWRVRRIPTDLGSCLNLRADGRSQPYGLRIQGSPLLGLPCPSSPDAPEPEYELNLDLLRNGAQIVSGPVPAGTTGATVHLDGGATREIAPTSGGIAFAIVGNHIAPTVVGHAPDGDSTCSLSAKDRSYFCSSGPFTFGDATVPTFDTRPRSTDQGST